MTLPRLWGSARWPDGSADAPPLGSGAFGLAVQRLALAPGSRPWAARAEGWPAFVAQRRPDEPIPLAVASFGYALEGQPALRAFAMAPLLHAGWQGGVSAQLRSRVVRWWLDRRFTLVDDDPASAPGALQLDAGDGLGPRAVPTDGIVTAAYGAGQARVTLTLHAAGRQARTEIAIGPPVAPLPDITLTLPGGTAWVFLAPGHDRPRRPVVVCEGFPGGYACDTLHDLMNQHGLLDAMRAAGHDVVLLGYAHGAGPIEASSAVLVAAIRQLQATATSPLAVGGVSMGGLVARHALAWMESQGLDHGTALYFSIDTPHQGSYTSLAVQWFALAMADTLAGAAAYAGLMASSANQQFVKRWLRREGDGWASGESPLRTAFVAGLQAVGGYPQRPRKVALSCGRGDGQASIPPGATLLQWSGAPAVQLTLRALSAGGSVVVGEAAGTALPSPPSVPPSVPPVVPPANIESDTAWEGLPGGTNLYVGVAGALAAAPGCGNVVTHWPVSLAVPTVSALDMALAPDAPIPATGPAPTPFDAWHHADENLSHLQLTPALRDALLAELPRAAL
jgi:hypothetical protein